MLSISSLSIPLQVQEEASPVHSSFPGCVSPGLQQPLPWRWLLPWLPPLQRRQQLLPG